MPAIVNTHTARILGGLAGAYHRLNDAARSSRSVFAAALAIVPDRDRHLLQNRRRRSVCVFIFIEGRR